MRLKIWLFVFLLLATTRVKAETKEKTKVFIECARTWLCDYDYLKTELAMVDFVRDRFIADVHVLVKTEFASSGSEQNTIEFIGQNNFAKRNDTLVYYNSANVSDDEKRKNMLRQVQLGLIQYVIHSGIAADITINYVKPLLADTAKKEEEKDPWNYWIMSLGSSGFFDGDANYSSQSLYSYVNADRETDKTKTNLGFSYSYRRNEFKISDDETVVRETPQTNAYANYIRKINSHWGYGIFSSFAKSEFSNLDMKLNFMPKIEYDVFPYKDFNSQRIVISYGFGGQYNDYLDTTIFFKTKESLLIQEASVINSITKPWGSINVGAFYNNYLMDLKKYSLSFSGSVNWNIFKGFKFAVGGSYDITRNLIQLPKRGATRDEVLLQQRQLNTAYSYFFGVGFSYQFGSKFNNYINPVFKGLSWSLNF